jgi:hypothetical protein
MKHVHLLIALIVAPSLGACGGGSGAPTPAAANAAAANAANALPSPGVTASPNRSAPASPLAVNVAGTVVSDTMPLTNATVVIGPAAITGATPPAVLPAGDVAVATNASGAFAATIPAAPGPPSSSEPFVVPPDNILGTTPPATGYYIEVFGSGSDGATAGTTLPIHRFAAASLSIALVTSAIAPAEAAALAAVNADRARFAAAPLIFDAVAEIVARAHALDEVGSSTTGYYCHYDTHNAGPSSRYLAAGGLGLTGENLALPGSGVTTATAAFQIAETGFMAEQSLTPPGSHFTNIVDTAHRWAGLAAIATPVTNTVFTGGFYAVDYELVTPDAIDAVGSAYGYPVISFCPPGTTMNES